MEGAKNGLAGEYTLIDYERIRPNPWNPNEMDDETLNRLMYEIETLGMIEPIQVIQVEPDKDGRDYMIIGGEHRWMTMGYLNYEQVPSIVLTSKDWQDEDTQKFVTMRLNVLRGKLNPEKFKRLYQDLAKRYSHEDMKDQMGFTDDDAYKQATKDMVKRVSDSNLPEVIKEDFKKKVKDKKYTLQALSKILNDIFTKHGSTLDHHYIFFDYGGHRHVKIKSDKYLFDKVSEFVALAPQRGVSAMDLFKDMIRSYDVNRINSIPKLPGNNDGSE